MSCKNLKCLQYIANGIISANIHLFKGNNRNSSKMVWNKFCKNMWKGVKYVMTSSGFLLLTLNLFYTFFKCLCCYLEQVNVSCEVSWFRGVFRTISVCSFATAKLLFLRNDRIWKIGLVCKASSFVSHQTRWNKTIFTKTIQFHGTFHELKITNWYHAFTEEFLNG